MKYKQDIILILDIVLDDYYLLWECFEEYKQNIKLDCNLKKRFHEVIKEAYINDYFNFFVGESFDGDEILISKFNLSNSNIDKLLDYNYKPIKEIRITTSNSGIELLEKCYK